jgi:PhnB protein
MKQDVTMERKSAATRAAEKGVHVVSPYLTCKGAAEAIEFYHKALGADVLMRMDAPDGRVLHACLRINGSSVMLGDEMPECGAMGPATLGGSPVSIHLVVDDADEVFAKAIAAGATAVQEPTDMFWGDRFGAFKDPWGHAWSIGTPVHDLSGAELCEAAAHAMGAPAV